MVFTVVGVTFWYFGNISAVLLFLAPVITFKKIISSKSTQEFSGIPYTLTLLNCLVMLWYTLFSWDGFIMFIVFASGAGIELIYVIIFLVYAPKKEKRKIGAILGLVLLLFAAIALISVFVFFERGTARIFCGFAVAMSGLAMYASPLSIMRVVKRTKSTEFMPVFMSLFMLLYAASWFIFSLFERDPYLALPSMLGSGLGILQLVLYARYRDNPNRFTTGALDLKFSTGPLDMGVSHADLQRQPDLELATNRPL